MAQSFEVDMRDVERHARKLERLAKQGVPHAIRNGLNRTAFAARKTWQVELKQSFTLRNQYTLRSIRVEPARGLNPNRMISVVGSVAPFMRERESGKTKPGSLPTAIAAGQAQNTIPRTRLVRKHHKMGRIQLNRRTRKGSRVQRNAAAIRQAVDTKKRYILLEGQRKRVIARVTGKRKVRVKAIWDVSNKTYRVPPMPTLERTLKQMAPRIPRIYGGAFLQQLKRHGL